MLPESALIAKMLVSNVILNSLSRILGLLLKKTDLFVQVFAVARGMFDLHRALQDLQLWL